MIRARKLTKKLRLKLKKGPRRYGVPRPKSFGLVQKRKENLENLRYRRKWNRKLENWWRNLTPKDLQPELRRMVGLSMNSKLVDQRLKKKLSSIAGLGQLPNNWYAELGTHVGYSIDLMNYVYRRRPTDFTGFAKYFLLKSLKIRCIEDMAELGELYDFLEKNFQHEMKTHAYAVRVHTSWLQKISEASLMHTSELYGGIQSSHAHVGFNIDGSFINGLKDEEFNIEDAIGISQLNKRLNEAFKVLSIKFTEEEAIQLQNPDAFKASQEDQEELNAFLLLARYVSAFEQKLASISDPDLRPTVSFFSTYLLAKSVYEQFRPNFQWHPICAARSVDFVKNRFPVAGNPERIFKQYFVTPDSEKRHEGQFLIPSSYTYEGLLRALISSGKLNKFIEYSRYYQDRNIHSLALKKIYKTGDVVLGQRFIVKNYKCSIDELTKKQNCLEPSIEDYAFMIAIFMKNEKRQSTLRLCDDLLRRVQTHPEEVIGCKGPFAEIKDYTKIRDREIFARVYEAETLIKNEQQKRGVKIGFGVDLNVDPNILKQLRAVTKDTGSNVKTSIENTSTLTNWKAKSPSVYLTLKQKRQKTLRLKKIKAWKETKAYQRSLATTPNPHKNFFKVMNYEQFKEYTENQQTVFNLHRQKNKYIEALLKD